MTGEAMHGTDLERLEECYSSEQVAKILNVSTASVYRNKWELGAIKVGKSVRFPRNFLEVLVADAREAQREQACRYEAKERADAEAALQQNTRFKKAAHTKCRVTGKSRHGI